jgi:hypothetical protein
MRLLQLGFLLFMVLTPLISFSEVLLPQNRSLIAVVDLVDHATSRKWLYRIEDTYAAKLIKYKTRKNYKNVIILKKSEATLENFLKGLKSLANLAPNEPIDVIFYIHGLGDKSPTGPSLCFVGQPCIPVKDVSEKIKEATSHGRLGFLYSDACWGSQHMVDMLAAGFVVVAGSTKVDANNTSDLRRFLKLWNKGKSFKHAINFANRNMVGKIKDLLVKNAKSYKIVKGDGDLRW